MSEEWNPIIGFEELYEISNLGRVKSLWKWQWNNSKKRIMKLFRLDKIYSLINLHKNWFKKTKTVHRLVALHFIPNPLNLPCVLHKDETLIDWRLYNWADNLFWGTLKDNSQDMSKKGRQWLQWKFWKENPLSKPVNQYTKKWIFIQNWDSATDIQRELWISNSHIWSCCKGKLKSSWWFLWRYI